MLATRLTILLLTGSAMASAFAAPADSCLKLLDENKAREAISQAEQTLVQSPHHYEVLLCKGRAELSLGQSQAAIGSFTAAESAAANPHQHLLGHIFKGHAYKSSMQPTHAQVSYEEALTLAEQEKNQKFQVITHLVVGELLVETAQFLPAKQHYEQALKLAANYSERADANYHLAELEARQDRYEEAIPYQLQAMVMYATHGSFDEYANAGLELAYYHLRAKDFINAEKNINRVLNKAREAEDGYWLAKSYHYLGLTYAASQQLPQARESFQQALDICEAVGAEKLAAEVRLQFSKLPQ